jgi:hypothetical protein
MLHACFAQLYMRYCADGHTSECNKHVFRPAAIFGATGRQWGGVARVSL